MNENVLICSVIKNAGNNIKRNIDLAIETGKKFTKSKIVIYENNSTDNTKEELMKYNNDENIKIISEDIELPTKNTAKIWAYTDITGSDHPCRIEMITNARNKLIDEINKSEYDEYNYVIWIDMDAYGWNIDGIDDSFEKKDYWDVVYCKNPEHCWQDAYAYRSDKFMFGPEILGEHFWDIKHTVNLNGNYLIPVYSHFGGLGIFKKHIFKKYRYDCIVNDTVKQIYKNIIKKNIEKIDTNRWNTVQNPDGKFPNGYKDDNCPYNIFWKSNSGYDKPLVCEHIAFNFELIKDGYHIFVNPKMVFYNDV